MSDKQATGQPMILPGLEGKRFRLQSGQKMPMLKKDDPVQPTPVADAHVQVFDLSKPKDLEKYTRVWDEAAKGDVMISVEERHWCEQAQNFKIFLRWGEVFLELPNLSGRTTHDGRIYE